MAVPASHVGLYSEDGKYKIIAWLGQEPPQFSGGVGGWEAVNRPGLRPLTVFRGVQDPLKLTLPILIDGFLDKRNDIGGESVETQCGVLERMGGLAKDDPEPPRLIVDGSLPPDESGARANLWVIDTLEWGDVIRRVSDGHRVRQAVTVGLLLYTEDDALARLKRARRTRVKYVKARKGDTYTKIAAKHLGKGGLGNKLARLNGKRDGSTTIKPGTKVKLPSADALRDWKRK